MERIKRRPAQPAFLVYKDSIETYLKEAVAVFPVAESIKRDMAYVLFSGGKRVRPILGYMVLQAYDALQPAFVRILTALELIHTYSLVHDDLPIMDNDDMRRGRPTLHKVKNETYAAIVGNMILNLALHQVIRQMNDTRLAMNRKQEIIHFFDEKAGFNGMVGGQILDMNFAAHAGRGKLRSAYFRMIALKTGRLIELAIDLAAIMAGVNRRDRDCLASYGRNAGLLFQVVDDILDTVGDETLLGKPVKSDEKNEKITAVSLYGVQGARRIAAALRRNAAASLKPLGHKANELLGFVDFMANRLY